MGGKVCFQRCDAELGVVLLPSTELDHMADPGALRLGISPIIYGLAFP
jgi:hypothetical protein